MAYEAKALSGLTEIFDAELALVRAEYADVSQRVSELKQRLQELDKTTRSEVQVADLGFSATGADLAWRTWVEQRRRAMMRDLAKLMAEREGVRQRLRKANGKAKSFEAVVFEKQRQQMLKDQRKAQKELEFNLVIQEINS